LSPVQLAQQHCANYDQSRCLGADVWSKTCRPLKVCLLHESKPCRYFEICVLPNAKYGNPQILEAKRTYERSFGPGPSLNACDCGKPMAPGKRLCESCRIQNRRATLRKEKQRQRSQTS
jgi:hypothetical protein